jgi:hypothetical protein
MGLASALSRRWRLLDAARSSEKRQQGKEMVEFGQEQETTTISERELSCGMKRLKRYYYSKQ